MKNNDTYTTDGVAYRTPSSPEVIAAFGRAAWNFLNLEELLATILYEGDICNLVVARKLMAAQKKNELSKLIKKLKTENAPEDLIDLGELAVEAFHIATYFHRNPMFHAGPYTLCYDAHGVYQPGLVLDDNGVLKYLTTALEIHHEALEIEKGITPLSNFREGLGEWKKLKVS